MNVLKWTENLTFIAFVLASFLSLLFSFSKISLLHIAKDSRQIIEEIPFLNKLRSRLPYIFTPFWQILIALLIAMLVRVLTAGTVGISSWFNFLIQIILAGQILSFKEKVIPIINARMVFLKQGTLAGLDNLKEPLYYAKSLFNYQATYENRIEQLLRSLPVYFLPSLLLFYFVGWYGVFFYLAFMIQYEYFAEENPLVKLILIFPINIVNSIYRAILNLYKADTKLKKEFEDKFLQYDKLGFYKKAKEKMNSFAELPENLSNELNSDTINLEYLKLLQVIYLTTMNLMLLVFFLGLYFRTII